jgi:hypothetical protein
VVSDQFRVFFVISQHAELRLRCSYRSCVRLLFSIPSISSIRPLLFASSASALPVLLRPRRTPMFATVLSSSASRVYVSGAILCASGVCKSASIPSYTQPATLTLCLPSTLITPWQPLQRCSPSLQPCLSNSLLMYLSKTVRQHLSPATNSFITTSVSYPTSLYLLPFRSVVLACMVMASLTCPSLPALPLSWLYCFNSFSTLTWNITRIVSVVNWLLTYQKILWTHVDPYRPLRSRDVRRF